MDHRSNATPGHAARTAPAARTTVALPESNQGLPPRRTIVALDARENGDDAGASVGRWEMASMAEKHEVIGAIQQLNPAAAPEFLETFDERQLAAYLRRLGETTVWMEWTQRPTRSVADMVRVAPAA